MNNVILGVLLLSFYMVLPYGTNPGYAESPDETLNDYINAMRNHNSSPDLDFYTQQTRQMLRGWNVSPSQMDNIVNTYNGCHGGETMYNSAYSLAVIRYTVEQRVCSPWFFKNINGNWLLDLTMMQRVIRFGPGNAWHFDPAADHEYGFGFTDWNLNSSGYPVSSTY